VQFHIYVDQWKAEKPQEIWFQVPHECKKPAFL
jgi:hypothetical protein